LTAAWRRYGGWGILMEFRNEFTSMTAKKRSRQEKPITPWRLGGFFQPIFLFGFVSPANWDRRTIHSGYRLVLSRLEPMRCRCPHPPKAGRSPMLTFTLAAAGVRAEEVCPNRKTIEAPKPISTARSTTTATTLRTERILTIWRAIWFVFMAPLYPCAKQRC